MTTRPGGDFDQDAVDAFRMAYAQILNSPEDDNVSNLSGLPTDTVANTSPWHGHIPMWKYPSGRGPDEDLRPSFDPDEYITEDEEDSDGGYEGDFEDQPMTDEELEAIISELLNSDDEGESEGE